MAVACVLTVLIPAILVSIRPARYPCGRPYPRRQRPRHLWVVLQHKSAHVAEQLEYFHTRDLCASAITETTAAFTNQYMSATRINRISMGK